jgi:hypothetical protein
VQTSTSGVFEQLGCDPKAEYSIEKRLMIQEVVLSTMERQYRKAREKGQLFIADRTPIDAASYMLSEVHRTAIDSPEVSRLVNDCAVHFAQHVACGINRCAVGKEKLALFARLAVLPFHGGQDNLLDHQALFDAVLRFWIATQLLKDPAGGSLHKEKVVPLRVLPGQRGFAGAMGACKS